MTLLVISSLVGVVFLLYAGHRLLLLVLWWRHRKDVIEAPVRASEAWPVVTVQLPVYNEKLVIERLLDAAAVLDYPRDRLEIQVLDDSSDETTDLIAARVASLRAAGLSIEHLRRGTRDGFKAGALIFGLARARGELVAIFDADFVPPRDFLQRVVPFFGEAGLGMAQARWTFLNEGESYLTRTQAMSLRAHFRIEQFARNRSGRFFNFNGTAGLWRAQAIKDAGGWQGDTLTEDLDLSYRAQLAGWRFLYLDDVECPSELPPTVKALKAQQYRWMKGMAQVARKLLVPIWKSRVSMSVKLEATAHLLSPLAYVLTLVSFLLMVPLATMVEGRDLLGALLGHGFSVATGSLFVFHAATELRSPTWRGWFDLAGRFVVALVVGVGHSLNATRAAIEGLLGHQSPFERTPKYGALRHTGSAAAYRVRADPYFGVECGLAVLSAAALVGATVLESAILPWTLLFAVGWLTLVIAQVAESARGRA